MDLVCELCGKPGGELLWRDARCRVVRVEGAEAEAFPGFCRVIWTAHVAEMSDLAEADRAHLMRVVNGVERSLRLLLSPDKINLASLGNLVPHLHWHVVPRRRNDSHFPGSIWGNAVRAVPPLAPEVGSMAAQTFLDSAALKIALFAELGVSA